jgi:hypothetical protein
VVAVPCDEAVLKLLQWNRDKLIEEFATRQIRIASKTRFGRMKKRVDEI